MSNATCLRSIDRELLDRPTYGPDYPPRDCHLVGPLKQHFGNRLLRNSEEVDVPVRGYLHMKESSFSGDVILKLVPRGEKWMSVLGDWF
jgi:hypothetical protein